MSSKNKSEIDEYYQMYYMEKIEGVTFYLWRKTNNSGVNFNDRFSGGCNRRSSDAKKILVQWCISPDPWACRDGLWKGGFACDCGRSGGSASVSNVDITVYQI